MHRCCFSTLAVLTVFLGLGWNTGGVHAQVSGTVRDVATLLPIANAIVTLQGTDTRTTTDGSGNFSLPGVMGSDLVIVAAAQGYFHARPPTPSFTVTTPAAGLLYNLTAVPNTSDPNYVWRSNNFCGFCHADQIDGFQNSPMNLTGLNAWVYDLYNGTGTPGGMGGFVYTLDSIHAGTNPNAACASCHQPQHWLNNPPSVALSDLSNPSPDAVAGVSCEICHKVADADPLSNAQGFYPGSVTIHRPIEAGFNTIQVMYGPLGDVDYVITDAMNPSYNPDIRHETCAVCHQYNSDPDNDQDFNDPGSFPGQTTWSEWAASPYGDSQHALYQTCADCHMPATPQDDGCIIDPVVRLPGQIRSHEIRGTSPDFLENAATLTLDAQVVGNEVQVSVEIENDQTGHDLPTGINLRNMILLVEAKRVADNQPLVHTGAQLIDPSGGLGDPAQGYFGGLPGKLYGRFLENALGNGPILFTDAVAERFNTRIPALATDATDYSFAAPPAGGDVQVRARLIYRRAWRSLVDQKGWTLQGDGITPLADLQAPHFGHLMEEAVTTVTVVGTGQQFVRGNCNADGAYNIADPVTILGYLFPAMPPAPSLVCADACDCNDDGALNIADAICMLSGLFGMSTVPPAAPHPACGLDPPGTSLGCASFPPCP